MAILHLERVSEHAIVPSKATQYAACYDIHADILDRNIKIFDENNKEGIYPVGCESEYAILSIPPRSRALIPTGWKMQPEDGYCTKFLPRSGTALKNGITLANAVGVIDRDFSKETMLILHNTSDQEFYIYPGDRIGQLELDYVMPIELKEVDELYPLMSDRSGGFGSTGK